MEQDEHLKKTIERVIADEDAQSLVSRALQPPYDPEKHRLAIEAIKKASLLSGEK